MVMAVRKDRRTSVRDSPGERKREKEMVAARVTAVTSLDGVYRRALVRSRVSSSAVSQDGPTELDKDEGNRVQPEREKAEQRRDRHGRRGSAATSYLI